MTGEPSVDRTARTLRLPIPLTLRAPAGGCSGSEARPKVAGLPRQAT